jgi:hypothetical protein
MSIFVCVAKDLLDKKHSGIEAFLEQIIHFYLHKNKTIDFRFTGVNLLM